MKLLCEYNICYFCGFKMPEFKKGTKKFRSPIEIHHIVEQCNGGSDYDTNLVATCGTCHSKIHCGLIKIDRWYNVGYCYKLNWRDENGIDHFGPGY